MFLGFEEVEMRQCGGGAFVLLLLLLQLLVAVMVVGEKCFHCGDDTSPRCTHRMSLSLSDISADVVCVHLGSCVKFNGSAIIPPGSPCFISIIRSFHSIHNVVDRGDGRNLRAKLDTVINSLSANHAYLKAL